MALYYLETSALVKLYIREPGTEEMLRLTASRTDSLVVLALSQVEFRSAVRRRQRSGDLAPDVAGALIGSFARHIEGVFIRQTLSDGVLEFACDLLDRRPLRAYDAIQLAGFLVLEASARQTETFVCADRGLLAAAAAEGARVLDPAAP